MVGVKTNQEANGDVFVYKTTAESTQEGPRMPQVEGTGVEGVFEGAECDGGVCESIRGQPAIVGGYMRVVEALEAL